VEITRIKNYIKSLIKILISLLEENYIYQDNQLDENDPDKKIINTVFLDDYFVLSDSGYVPLSQIHITQPYTEYVLETESSKTLSCDNEHRVFDENFNEIFVPNP
jgi:hypothetical protein